MRFTSTIAVTVVAIIASLGCVQPVPNAQNGGAAKAGSGAAALGDYQVSSKQSENPVEEVRQLDLETSVSRTIKGKLVYRFTQAPPKLQLDATLIPNLLRAKIDFGNTLVHMDAEGSYEVKQEIKSRPEQVGKKFRIIWHMVHFTGTASVQVEGKPYAVTFSYDLPGTPETIDLAAQKERDDAEKEKARVAKLYEEIERKEEAARKEERRRQEEARKDQLRKTARNIKLRFITELDAKDREWDCTVTITGKRSDFSEVLRISLNRSKGKIVFDESVRLPKADYYSFEIRGTKRALSVTNQWQEYRGSGAAQVEILEEQTYQIAGEWNASKLDFRYVLTQKK